jgi:hypothetical protein
MVPRPFSNTITVKVGCIRMSPTSVPVTETTPPDRREPTTTAAIAISSQEFPSVGTDGSGLRRQDKAGERNQSAR